MCHKYFVQTLMIPVQMLVFPSLSPCTVKLTFLLFIEITQQWLFVMNLGADIHGAQIISLNEFRGALTFSVVPPAGH